MEEYFIVTNIKKEYIQYSKDQKSYIVADEINNAAIFTRNEADDFLKEMHGLNPELGQWFLQKINIQK
jgi:tRNA(Ile)-lysidine synthase TilS/MesJ